MFRGYSEQHQVYSYFPNKGRKKNRKTEDACQNKRKLYHVKDCIRELEAKAKGREDGDLEKLV